MKVGIEGSLFFKRSSGVGHYAKELTRAATKLSSDIDFEIIRHVLPFKKFEPPIQTNEHLGYRYVRWFPPAVYFQVFKRLGNFLPYDLIALRRYDVVLFFNFICFPLRRRTKGVIVIHDIGYVHFPEYVARKNLIWLKHFVPKSIVRANHIIAVSENTKREIINYYKVSPNKISVVPNAVDHAQFYRRNQDEIKKVIEKYALPLRYIHFHGTIEPRKNIEGIITAYAQLDNTLKDKYGLVLTGGKGWNDEAIYEKIDELKTSGHNIVLPGYIDGVDLPAIYSGARLFVFPSHYEGFGIPPLEAMACGVPVITSDNSSLPEVVGKAAVTVKAEDSRAITRAMEQILSNEKLAKELSRMGVAQAQKFSWEKSAKKLIEVLESL